MFIPLLFLIWRISLFILAAVAGSILPFIPRFPYSELFLTNSGLPSWVWSFANFDGVHYLTIAKSGYTAQFIQVFFPLFPLIIGFISRLIPFINPLMTGLIISNSFFILAMFVFRKLMRLDFKKPVINWMLVFLLTFPTSFFFGSLYTESVFMFFVLSSFYYARKKRWVLSGLMGALASFTRPVGIFLLPAMLWEYYQSSIRYHLLSIKNKSKILYLTLNTYYLIRSPVFLLIPLGLIIYMVYLQLNFHDWLYFWHAQPVFGAQRSGGSIILLPQVIWRYLKIFAAVPVYSETFFIPFIEFISTTGVLIILMAAYLKKVRISYLIFSLLLVLVPTLTGTFSSMPRYILPAFPIYIVLGIIKSRSIRIAVACLFMLLLVVLTILFTSGHWVA